MNIVLSFTPRWWNKPSISKDSWTVIGSGKEYKVRYRRMHLGPFTLSIDNERD